MKTEELSLNKNRKKDRLEYQLNSVKKLLIGT